MAKLRPWKDLFIVAVMTFIFGTCGILYFIKRLILAGPRKFFYVKRRNIRPDILAGNEYGEHIFIRLKNTRVKLHCVVSGPKDKPLMLFLHGFPEFWYSWRHQIKEFNKDYRTVAIDMRGYGESDKPQGISNYTLDKLVADVDELITLLGYSSCILVAHDWGGAIAWRVAADHPDKVKQLVICNIPHPTAFMKHLQSSISQMLKSWYVFFFQLPVIPIYFLLLEDLGFIMMILTGKGAGAKPGSFTDEDLECYKYNFAEYGDLTGPVNYYRATMRYEPNIHNLFKKISVPTLLVWGEHDVALESKMAELTKEHVEQLDVKYIKESSHWVQQDNPVEVNAFMREFLSTKF